MRYSNVIKTAYAAEAECGLEMDLGNYVAETLNSMELITHRAIAYILRKREKAAGGALKSSPIADTKDGAEPESPEKIVGRYNTGEWVEYVILA